MKQKLYSFEIAKEVEIMVYLEFMARIKRDKENKGYTVISWAEKILKEHDMSKTEGKELLDDAKLLGEFFNTVYEKSKIEDETLEKYFGAIVENEEQFEETSITAMLTMYLPHVCGVVECDEKAGIYSAAYHAFLYKGEINPAFVEREKLEHVNNFEKFLEELEKSDLEDGKKWKILSAVSNFEDYKQKANNMLSEVYEIYVDNLKMIESIIEKYKKGLENFLENATDKEFLKYFHMNFSEEKVPKMFFSLAVFNGAGITDLGKTSIDNYMFIGIFFYYASSLVKNKPSKKELQNVIKCLGEARKYEIVMSLLDSPCNGKTLAERLGITPATISHHIGALVSSGIIYIENVNTSTMKYYINREKVANALETLKELFT